jgi:hypothetical protein
MIYYRGPYGDAMLVATDVEDETGFLVARIPSHINRGGLSRDHDWIVYVAMPEEAPMLGMFSFTDERLRTFEWGLDDDKGESVITCSVSQNYSTTIEVDGEKRIRGQMVVGKGRGSTAQIAYDASLADLVVKMKAAIEHPLESPLVVPEAEQRPLFGKD